MLALAGSASVEKVKGWAQLVGSLRTKCMGSVPLIMVQVSAGHRGIVTSRGRAWV